VNSADILRAITIIRIELRIPRRTRRITPLGILLLHRQQVVRIQFQAQELPKFQPRQPLKF
jgi:hypothetical protein